MKQVRFVFAAALVAVALAPALSYAQCVPGPGIAKKFQATFVQAFDPCDYRNVVNTMTEGGIPACQPPATYIQAEGGNPNGWRWGSHGKGSVQIRASSAPLNGYSALNPPGDTSDLAIKFRLKGVEDAYGPVSGQGKLTMWISITLADRAGGDMTMIDFAADFSFTLANGAAVMKTSLDTWLNGTGQPGLPLCANVEVLEVLVRDENHEIFLTAGVFGSGAFVLTDYRAQCVPGSGTIAKKFQADFGQAFVTCGDPGGNTPNATTEGGWPACQPPQTFNQQAGDPANGWRLGPKGKGSLQITASSAPLNGYSALNPPGDTSDLAIKFKLKGVEDAGGPTSGPSGQGKLTMWIRITLADRVGGDMTVEDFPADFSFTLANGAAEMKTSLDTWLNGTGKLGLPLCANVEVLEISVLDENGNKFAKPSLGAQKLGPT
jgi:hypothetical protein